MVSFRYSRGILIIFLLVLTDCFTDDDPEKHVYQLFEQAAAELEAEYKETRLENHVMSKRQVSHFSDLSNIHSINLKTTPESARIHDSFMIALKVAKQLKSSNKMSLKSSIKLKSPPKFCPFSFDQFCDNTTKYRSIDGSCNNLESSLIGRSSTPYKRLMKTAYDDGLNEPRRNGIDGSPLPNARLVSILVHNPLDTPSQISHLGVMFGQFVDHDIAQSAATGSGGSTLKCSCNSFSSDCVNIPTPDMDDIDFDQQCMTMTRSAASFDKFDCTINAREQTNLATHWLDLSHVYGTDSGQLNKLRTFTGGRLRTSRVNNGREIMPPADAGGCVDESSSEFCFDSGDTRTNQNMMLVSIHTVWLREHNRIARSLAKLNPTWSDESLFQETRRILIAEYQHIIYSEWLPRILGDKLYQSNGLQPLSSGYFSQYDVNINPSLAAEFSTAAFRFGHSMVRSTLSKSDTNLVEISNLTMIDIILRPTEAFENGGLDSICRGLLVDPGTTFDPHFTDQIQNHLFETGAFSAQTKRFSLSAINIMRGRDHGLPPYVDFRRFVGLSDAVSFDNLTEIPIETRETLKRVYRNVGDIDAYTGGTSERVLEGALLGPTFADIVARQFRDFKFGDRFYYENGNDINTRFTLSQLHQLRKSSMSRIICDNLDVKMIQKNAFFQTSQDNPLVDCKTLKRVNLNKWKNEKLPLTQF